MGEESWQDFWIACGVGNLTSNPWRFCSGCYLSPSTRATFSTPWHGVSTGTL